MIGNATNFKLHNQIYSNIKDYDSVHITPSFNNTSYESHNLFMRKVSDIFSSSELAEMLQFCDQTSIVETIKRPDQVSREYLIGFNCDFVPVTYDEQGVPSINVSGRDYPCSLLNPHIKLPKTIKKCLLIGLQRFGKEMGWKNIAKKIACNLTRNRLPVQKEIILLDWHKDFSTDHSFIINLNNPHGEEKGWQGGSFCYAADSVNGDSIEEMFKKDRFETNQSSRRDSLHPTWKLMVNQNEGVLFSNLNTLHFVSSMTAYSKDNIAVNRSILTFFEKRNKTTEYSLPMHLVKPQPVTELSEFLAGILSSYSLPNDIHEKACLHISKLEDLGIGINDCKLEDPVDYYHAIQEQKLKMQKKMDALVTLLSSYDSKNQSRQVKEKITEWIYHS